MFSDAFTAITTRYTTRTKEMADKQRLHVTRISLKFIIVREAAEVKQSAEMIDQRLLKERNARIVVSINTFSRYGCRIIGFSELATPFGVRDVTTFIPTSRSRRANV